MLYDGDHGEYTCFTGIGGIQRVGEETGNKTIIISLFTRNNVES